MAGCMAAASMQSLHRMLLRPPRTHVLDAEMSAATCFDTYSDGPTCV
jgi:hypothetical protein